MTEGERLARIRDRLDAIAPGEWMLTAAPDGMMIEARADAGDLVPVLRFDARATADEMSFAADAPEAVRFLLGLVDRAILALRERTAPGSTPAPDTTKDYAAEAAMKCQEPAFKAFLEARHGLERPLTDERAAQRLRSVLRIPSRKILNEDTAAAQRWKSLRADFEAWRRAG